MTELFEFMIPAVTALIGIVAIVFMFNGIDDLIMDVAFVIWRLYRRFIFMRVHRRLSEKLLDPEREKLAAILVPAWQEDNVIERMLDNTVLSLKYDNYIIFVGVYPNDPKTIAAVESAQKRHPQKIVTVILDHDGPTTKADCLNGILQDLYEFEKELGRRFEFFVLDDAEDLVPAYELKVLNHLIPRKDVVQLAVFPAEAKWWEFTAGHYMDEFALLHLKDMRTREWLTGSIPSAGVGTGFSRRAIEIAREIGRGKSFNDNTLTEDYELPLHLARLNATEAFVDTNIVPVYHDALPRSHMAGTQWARQIPAIRSAFPRNLSAAIRQKSRWVLGISLQGWEHLGWKGNFGHRYMLFRDRRILIGNLVNVLGYGLVIITLNLWFARYVIDGNGNFPDVVPEGSWVWYLLIVNFFIMCFHLISRAIATYVIYGFAHALLSIPRAIWGNIINFAATVRALRIYMTAKRNKIARIPWEKTSHEFPM